MKTAKKTTRKTKARKTKARKTKAKKAKARKTKSRKTTRAVTVARSTRTTKSTKSNNKKGASMIKAHKAKQALVDRLETLGLLDQAAIERLEKKTEGLLEETNAGIDQVTSWDRSLHSSLGAFAEAGGDGSIKRNLQSLILWNDSIRDLPATHDGLEKAVAAIKRVVPFHGSSLYVRDPHGTNIALEVSVGFGVDLINRIRFSEGAGFSSWVASRKKPVLYASLHRNEAPGSEQVRSFMSVPLVIAGVCLGVLNLGHREENAYGEQMLRRLVVAAAALAALVQRFVSVEQIRAREISDPATDLATVPYFRSRLSEEVVRCRELGHSMSLLVLRLNELPEYAEQFGPDFRSRCRSELAQAVKEWAEPCEFVGHGNKDSLVVLMPSARREKAESRAASLAERINRHNFPRRKRMTMGFGIGTYPADAEDSQELLEFVDKASYEATRSRGEVGGMSQSLAV